MQVDHRRNIPRRGTKGRTGAAYFDGAATPLTPIPDKRVGGLARACSLKLSANNYGRDPPRSMTVITRTLPARSALSPTTTSLVPEHGLGIVSVINGGPQAMQVLFPRPMQVQVFFIHVASLPRSIASPEHGLSTPGAC